jgi:hypothetical protein
MIQPGKKLGNGIDSLIIPFCGEGVEAQSSKQQPKYSTALLVGKAARIVCQLPLAQQHKKLRRHKSS